MDIRRMDRTLTRSLIIAFIVALCGCMTARADSIYDFSQTLTTTVPFGYSGNAGLGNIIQTDTVVFSLTTDGTLGALAASNILSWNIELIDNLNSANDYDLTPGDSTLYLGAGLSASPTELSFDYVSGGQFLIYANSTGLDSGYHYFCLSTDRGACWAGETIAPDYSLVDGVLVANPGPLVDTTVTPEPPSMHMLLFSMAVFGTAFILKLRKSDSVRTHGTVQVS